MKVQISKTPNIYIYLSKSNAYLGKITVEDCTSFYENWVKNEKGFVTNEITITVDNIDLDMIQILKNRITDICCVFNTESGKEIARWYKDCDLKKFNYSLNGYNDLIRTHFLIEFKSEDSYEGVIPLEHKGDGKNE